MNLKIAAPLLFLLLIIIYLFGAEYLWPPGDILPGVMVKDVSVGGLRQQQAAKKLVSLQERLLDVPVTLTYGNQSWALSLREVGMKIDIDETIKRAAAVGRQGQLFEQLKVRHRVKKEGLIIQPVINIDMELLSNAVKNKAGHLNIPAEDASFFINERDEIVVKPSKNGQSIDMYKLKLKLEHELLVREKITLPVPVKEIIPEYTTSDIGDMGISGLLSSYTTKFDPSLKNRTYNIKVAANALDGLLVVPGEEVSFNQVVGPRSSEAGYKEAGVIINNELVEDLGGGVCQVSTTLYNAVLLADLEVVERKNHSLPVSYVPIGRDATVVYGKVDFKFQNNSGRCLYIKTDVGDGRLTVKIFGDANHKKKVVINSWIEKVLEQEVVYQKDENLLKGQEVIKQEGNKGYIAHTERVIIENGQILRKDKLPASRYNPVDKIIAVGTAEHENSIDLKLQ